MENTFYLEEYTNEELLDMFKKAVSNLALYRGIDNEYWYNRNLMSAIEDEILRRLERS